MPQVSICAFFIHPDLTQRLEQALPDDRYTLKFVSSIQELLDTIRPAAHLPDCLLIEDHPDLIYLGQQLRQQSTMLPIVLVETPTSVLGPGPEGTSEAPPKTDIPSGRRYHEAEVFISARQFDTIDRCVDQAIALFLRLSPTASATEKANRSGSEEERKTSAVLLEQQRRLGQKLKERLGYLGVYYKRDPNRFLRHLPPEAARSLLDTLTASYQEIILHYFTDTSNLNSLIDEFVNLAFFADISVTQIVEIHMELMDAFSKQLKLEGRSEEMLVDYRLTLLDTIAHLCEMYRRSIPRES